MESLDKFMKADGTIDHEAWGAARDHERRIQRENGTTCLECGNYISLSQPSGHPERCSDCKAVDKPEKLRHPSKFRCPKCGVSDGIGDSDHYELYEEGEHEVSCAECGHDFKVSTSVSYTFTSPPRMPSE